MENVSMINLFYDNPVFGAIKNDKELELVLKSECRIVFILYGNLCTIAQIVKRIKESNKIAFVHVDMLEGTSSKDVVVHFLKATTDVDGVISTKISMVKAAKAQGLTAIHRMFVLDSLSLSNLMRQISLSQPDFIEILPGVMTKIIKQVVAGTKTPVIASGLICTKEDIIGALDAGACGVSSTCKEVWEM
jgi:glycerol uptake operon antiterminator